MSAFGGKAELGETNGTILDSRSQKCDILQIPDVVLGWGEAMRRREFIALAGCAAAGWPLAARAQQSALPVVGFLRPSRAEEFGHLVAAVRQGLRESGYTNDKVVI